MCDVFLVIISAKECQTDVLTKVGTILLCSFVFNGISHHRHFIFDFFFCTMYPCPDLLLEGVSKQWIKCKNYSKFCPMKDRRLGGWLVYNYDVKWNRFESSADWLLEQWWVKCCTVPCQRISFAQLYSGRTLIFFSSTVRPNWVKNILIVKCLASSVKQNLFVWVSVLTYEWRKLHALLKI